MSKGPVFVSTDNFKKCYLHVELTPKDWCTYEGTCRINQLAIKNGECNCCKYKKPIDVPTILEKLHSERNGCRIQQY